MVVFYTHGLFTHFSSALSPGWDIAGLSAFNAAIFVGVKQVRTAHFCVVISPFLTDLARLCASDNTLWPLQEQQSAFCDARLEYCPWPDRHHSLHSAAYVLHRHAGCMDLLTFLSEAYQRTARRRRGTLSLRQVRVFAV